MTLLCRCRSLYKFKNFIGYIITQWPKVQRHSWLLPWLLFIFVCLLFVVYQVRLRDVYKNPAMRFNITSCQFSLHYCFESAPQAEMMLQNLCENLRPGGFFIGTTVDSNELVWEIQIKCNVYYNRSSSCYYVYYAWLVKRRAPFWK